MVCIVVYLFLFEILQSICKYIQMPSNAMSSRNLNPRQNIRSTNNELPNDQTDYWVLYVIFVTLRIGKITFFNITLKSIFL